MYIMNYFNWTHFGAVKSKLINTEQHHSYRLKAINRISYKYRTNLPQIQILAKWKSKCVAWLKPVNI